MSEIYVNYAIPPNLLWRYLANSGSHIDNVASQNWNFTIPIPEISKFSFVNFLSLSKKIVTSVR